MTGRLGATSAPTVEPEAPAGAAVALVTTVGRGSMDRYGQRLARELGAPAIELGLAGASAGAFNVAIAGRRSLRAVAGDVALVRRLRREPGPLHLTHHHLARYANALAVPYVVTAHDLIRYFDATGATHYITRPNLRDRLLLRLDYRGIARATALIAPSKATRRDLVRHLEVPAERIHVVPLGIDHALFRPVERRLVDPPYVLFVGSEHPRKNLATLLRAFAAVKADPRFADLTLVKVGAPGDGEAPFREPTRALVHELGLADQVLLTEEVPDDDLPAYYAGAECLVLPSLYEGFGIPPLEAMACGCPVIVSTAGSLPEVAGPAALTVAPRDPDGLRSAIVRLLTDRALGDDLRARGLEHARRFSWRRTARETLAVHDVVRAGVSR